jgi:hypothetical protein
VDADREKQYDLRVDDLQAMNASGPSDKPGEKTKVDWDRNLKVRADASESLE